MKIVFITMALLGCFIFMFEACNNEAKNEVHGLKTKVDLHSYGYVGALFLAIAIYCYINL